MADPVRRNPVPSLLRSLMSDHLDPGYEAAASLRSTRGRGSGRGDAMIAALGALLVGGVFGIGISQLAVNSPDGPGEQQVMLASVRDAENRAADLAEKRRSLDEQLDAARADALYAGATGESLLAELAALEADAAATPISGPGIEVTIVEPSPPADLSDVSRPARGSSDTAVLDGDLRVLVNSLWVSGAEAVAVGDVRIGPGVTIRQAGGAMLVDNRPVFSPYTVTAVGSPTLLQTRLAVSDAYLRLSALEQLYRVAFEIRAVPELTMPATVVRTMRSAERGGQP